MAADNSTVLLSNGVPLPMVGFGCAGKLGRAPIGAAIDAGFTKPVVALVYDEAAPQLSRDGRFVLPKGTYSYPETSCSRSRPDRVLDGQEL